MEIGKICCFTGHRPGKLPWREDEWDRRCVALKERMMVLLREAYRQGYRHFITGMARGIDTYCCEAVLRLRREYSDVVLEAAIPCCTQAQRWRARDQERYRRLLAQCDLKTLIQPRLYTGVYAAPEPVYGFSDQNVSLAFTTASLRGGPGRRWPMR